MEADVIPVWILTVIIDELGEFPKRTDVVAVVPLTVSIILTVTQLLMSSPSFN